MPVQISQPLTRDPLPADSHWQAVAERLDAMGAVTVPDPDPLDRVRRPLSVLRLRPATSDPRAIQRADPPPGGTAPAATD